MLQASRLALLSLLLPLSAAGCGGSTALGEGGDGGARDSSVQDGATADAPSLPDTGNPDASPWSAVCPASAPTPGDACSQENLQCEYGAAWWNIACDKVLQCQSGVWAAAMLAFDPCTPAPGPNASVCPSSYAAVPTGAACGAQGTNCLYPQGECSCQFPLGGPLQIDGGNASWQCLPEPGCPWPRPRIGSACSSNGQSCTYEACSYGQLCSGGTWQGSLEGCAGAAGGPGQ
jgi:hypothetical protein